MPQDKWMCKQEKNKTSSYPSQRVMHCNWLRLVIINKKIKLAEAKNTVT